jgi:hypothetical protein
MDTLDEHVGRQDPRVRPRIQDGRVVAHAHDHARRPARKDLAYSAYQLDLG